MLKIKIPPLSKNKDQASKSAFAINARINSRLIAEIIAEFKNQTLRFGVIGLQPNDNIKFLINEMEINHHQLIYFADNHLITNNNQQIDFIRILEKKLKDKARISTPQNALTTVELITSDIIDNLKLDLIFFNTDLDGLLSFLMATSYNIGIPNNKIVQFAQQLACNENQQLPKNLEIIQKSLLYIPPNGIFDRPAREQAQNRIYQTIINWLEKDCPQKQINELGIEAEHKYQLFLQNIEYIIKRIQLERNIALADARSILELGEVINLKILKKHIIEKCNSIGHWPALICILNRYQHHNENTCSVIIELPTRWQNQYNLDKILPKETFWTYHNYRAEIPLNTWQKFKQKWFKLSLGET